VVLGVVSLCTFTGCKASSSEVEAAKPTAGQATQAEPQGIAVQVAKPVWRKIQRTARGQGALFAKESVVLATKLPGYVSHIAVDFGDRVKAGQTLVQIEQEEFELQVDSAESALEHAQAHHIRARADFERAQQLAAEELIPPQRRDAAEADFKVAGANVRSAEKALALARKRLKDTRITSPVNGFVQQRFVNSGEYMTAGAKLLEVVDVHPLKLRTPVPERYARMAHVGLQLQVEVDALPGERFNGKITRIAAGADQATRSLLVEAEIPNPEGRLRPGYFAHVTGVMGEETVLFIPRSGVYRYAGVERIFVIRDNKVTSREVKTGVEDGNLIEIAGGLADSEYVAVSLLERLADGMVVQPQLAEAR
jgi:membrane fusion protein (multidrug efflux system)